MGVAVSRGMYDVKQAESSVHHRLRLSGAFGLSALLTVWLGGTAIAAPDVNGATPAIDPIGRGEANVAPTESKKIKIARCVRYWTEARYRNHGYDHVVHVQSRCDQPVRCEVSTNVDPSPIVVDLQPQQQEAVVTRVGSPARKFVARVACHFIESDGGAGTMVAAPSD